MSVTDDEVELLAQSVAYLTRLIEEYTYANAKSPEIVGIQFATKSLLKKLSDRAFVASQDSTNASNQVDSSPLVQIINSHGSFISHIDNKYPPIPLFVFQCPTDREIIGTTIHHIELTGTIDSKAICDFPGYSNWPVCTGYGAKLVPLSILPSVLSFLKISRPLPTKPSVVLAIDLDHCVLHAISQTKYPKAKPDAMRSQGFHHVVQVEYSRDRMTYVRRPGFGKIKSLARLYKDHVRMMIVTKSTDSLAKKAMQDVLMEPDWEMYAQSSFEGPKTLADIHVSPSEYRHVFIIDDDARNFAIDAVAYDNVTIIPINGFKACKETVGDHDLSDIADSLTIKLATMF